MTPVANFGWHCRAVPQGQPDEDPVHHQAGEEETGGEGDSVQWSEHDGEEKL